MSSFKSFRWIFKKFRVDRKHKRPDIRGKKSFWTSFMNNSMEFHMKNWFFFVKCRISTTDPLKSHIPTINCKNSLINKGKSRTIKTLLKFYQRKKSPDSMRIVQMCITLSTVLFHSNVCKISVLTIFYDKYIIKNYTVSYNSTLHKEIYTKDNPPWHSIVVSEKRRNILCTNTGIVTVWKHNTYAQEFRKFLGVTNIYVKWYT